MKKKKKSEKERLPIGEIKKENSEKEEKGPAHLDDELEIIGHTQSADDYKHFQWSEATMSDADSLFMREQAIAKGERLRGTNIMTYVGAILALAIGGIVAYFIFQEVVLGGGGLGEVFHFGGGGGKGGPVTEGFIPTLFVYLKLRCNL